MALVAFLIIRKMGRRHDGRSYQTSRLIPQQAICSLFGNWLAGLDKDGRAGLILPVRTFPECFPKTTCQAKVSHGESRTSPWAAARPYRTAKWRGRVGRSATWAHKLFLRLKNRLLTSFTKLDTLCG